MIVFNRERRDTLPNFWDFKNRRHLPTKCNSFGRQCRGSKGSKGSTHLFSGESRPMLRVRHLAVMFEQQVFTEIIFKVPPDRVNVVIVVLGIVVFQQEGRSLGAVVM